ncbi:MAG: efflux RND transporter periplasmic adaptor subunit [Flavobacteriaceae bacterium]|nr:efflux RND transporter periplasmic adaptor subunit [Flavobacteriaceae bacterium]
MNKKKLLVGGVVLLCALFGYAYFDADDSEETSIYAEVTKGTFINEVIISGEVQSTSLKKINGPKNVRKFKLRDIKIQDLIPEGTIVNAGDYVGRLDPSGVNEQIIDAKLNLESAQSKFTQEQIDTTLSLKQERNSIKDLEFRIEQSRLELKQSIYEPPATIKKLEIELAKNERDLKEKKDNYFIIRKKAIAKMVEVGTEVSKIKKTLGELEKLQQDFTIHTDSPGMVTYAKTWDGSKKKVGSTVSMWDLTIVTLPDLSKMQSKTYANEVDIRKIKNGLPVTIGFDAFPDLELEGEVTQVANVGESKRGSDIKVFQVLIKLKENDKSVKPGMTTSNAILIDKQENVLKIPLESVFSKDSIQYAFVKKGFGIEKRQVKLGMSNLNEVIVLEGLKEMEEVSLNLPEGMEDKAIKMLEK